MSETMADSSERTQRKSGLSSKIYNSVWEDYQDFKGWLAHSKRGERWFYCKACDCDYKGGLDAVKYHSLWKQHQERLNAPPAPVEIKTPVEITELTDKNFNKVAASCDAVLIVFYSHSPYSTNFLKKEVEEIAEQLTEEFKGRVRIGIVDYVDCKKLTKRFEVCYTPLVVLYQYKGETIRFNGRDIVNSIVDFVRNEIKIDKPK